MLATAVYQPLKNPAVVTKNVLIVDDEEPVISVVQSCFEDLAGWKVLTATSGYQGLLIARTHSPDAIVLDVMMPDMDGFTVLRKLKSQPETQSIPVVLLTAKVGLIESLQTMNLDLAGAIAKPFDPFALVDQVADFLGWSIDS